MRQSHRRDPKTPPTPTDLNLSALEGALAETSDGVIRRVSPTDAPHLRRCIDAGLLEPAGARAWHLSAAGVSALAARRLRVTSCFPGYRPQFLNRELLAETVTIGVQAQQLTTAEGAVLVFCWDEPSTMPDAVARLGMPSVLAEALTPGRFTTDEARGPFTLADLLAANHDWPLHPADSTAIVSLHPGDAYVLRQGAGGDTVLRCEGTPPRQRCSTLARRLSNLLTLDGKVLHADRPGSSGSEPAAR